MLNSFRLSGTLTVTGAILVAASYFIIGSVPLAASGLSLMIIGLTGTALAKTRPHTLSETRRTFPKLMASVIIAFGIIDVLLLVLGQRDFSLYLSLNAIAYLIIVMVYLSFNPGARLILTVISTVILAWFLIIMAFKIFEIIK